MSAPALVRLTGISKYFPENGIHACRRLDLDLRGGEVHALLGENGAGKSTLMKILAGLVKPDAGTITYPDGQTVAGGLSAHKTRQAGIGILLQHAPWADDLTLEEHALLGQEGGLLPGARGNPQRTKLRAWADELDFDLPWKTRCRDASSLDIQKASLLSLLQQDCQVLILDEPTSSLPPQEAERLLAVMRKLADRGLAVVHITHKLAEVMVIADRVTVLKQGSITHRLDRRGLELETLQDLLLDLAAPHSPHAAAVPGQTVFELDLGPGGRFAVRAGEILGLGGLRDEGLEALEDFLLTGQGPLSGRLTLLGQALEPGAAALRRQRTALIPSRRMTAAVNLAATLDENSAATHLPEIDRQGWLPRPAITRFFEGLKQVFGLRGQAREAVGSLSGGNIQRLILARELRGQPPLVILSEPDWGLDVASRQELARRLKDLRQSGSALLLLSSEIQDLLEVCDRIGVFHHNTLVDLRDRAAWTTHDLSRKMLGY